MLNLFYSKRQLEEGKSSINWGLGEYMIYDYWILWFMIYDDMIYDDLIWYV